MKLTAYKFVKVYLFGRRHFGGGSPNSNCRANMLDAELKV